jgi:hypothetical protein
MFVFKADNAAWDSYHLFPKNKQYELNIHITERLDSICKGLAVSD